MERVSIKLSKEQAEFVEHVGAKIVHLIQEELNKSETNSSETNSIALLVPILFNLFATFLHFSYQNSNGAITFDELSRLITRDLELFLNSYGVNLNLNTKENLN